MIAVVQIRISCCEAAASTTPQAVSASLGGGGQAASTRILLLRANEQLETLQAATARALPAPHAKRIWWRFWLRG